MTPASEKAGSDGCHSSTGILATEIQVRDGRLLLLWPLALHLREPARGADDMAKAVGAVAERLCKSGESGGVWRRVSDPIEHIAPPENDGVALKRWQNDAYAEAVYFHEFVQSFLFRKQSNTECDGPFHLFRRSDIGAVKVAFAGAVKTLTVERLNLYLFRTGAAILVVELRAKPLEDGGTSGWTLAEFQDFHDHFRRVYAPFFTWSKEEPRGPCFKAPKEVVWLASEKDEEALTQRNLDGACESGGWTCAQATADVGALIEKPASDGRRFPPVFGHWRFLLAGALPFAGEEAPIGEGRWHQVVDERMPSMATLSLTPVQEGKPVWEALGWNGREEAKKRALAACDAVRDGDHMRLCFADDQGADPYPYDREFLVDDQKFWSKNAYTRFRSMGTLFLFSGYAFVAVGAGYDFDNYVMVHVRRHYFQMGLLAHFELASLLAFSSQISRAIERLDRDNDQAEFQSAMLGIEEQFLQFVHRFRFTGVSNQIQAQEIFAKWRALLRLDEIFKDVENEVHTANQFLASRTQTRTSFAATRLSHVAALGVFLGLAFSMLGMNVVFTEKNVGGYPLVAQMTIGFGIAGIVMLLGGALLQLLRPDEFASSRPVQTQPPRALLQNQSPRRARLQSRVQAWLRALRRGEPARWDPFAILLFGIGGAFVALMLVFALIGCFAR